jgi:cysteinyl-tRNA synthetase
MANYWMHNGHLQVEGEKMSKSLGNFVTIHELLHTNKFGGLKWPGSVLRFALLTTHYRQPIDFTVAKLEEAATRLSTFNKRTLDQPEIAPPKQFVDALLDDLNTPQAIVQLNDLFDQSSRDIKAGGALRSACRLVGIEVGEVDLSSMLRDSRSDIDDNFIAARVKDRLAARVAKNWKESDRIRNELAAMGIGLKDNKDGTTTWEVKR